MEPIPMGPVRSPAGITKHLLSFFQIPAIPLETDRIVYLSILFALAVPNFSPDFIKM
jgi:hypothetical protein